MEDIWSMKERASGCLGYRGYYTTQLCRDPYSWLIQITAWDVSNPRNFRDKPTIDWCFFPLISSMNGEATLEFKEQTFMLATPIYWSCIFRLYMQKKHCLAAVTVPTTGRYFCLGTSKYYISRDFGEFPPQRIQQAVAGIRPYILHHSESRWHNLRNIAWSKNQKTTAEFSLAVWEIPSSPINGILSNAASPRRLVRYLKVSFTTDCWWTTMANP